MGLSWSSGATARRHSGIDSPAHGARGKLTAVVMNVQEMRQLLLQSFANKLELDRAELAEPGVLVVPRDDRAGSAAALAYWADARLVVWCDPEVDHLLADFAHNHADATPDRSGLAAWMDAVGFSLIADADMRILSRTPRSSDVELASDYHVRSVASHDRRAVQLIGALVERCDPVDAEEAPYDDLDHLERSAITLIVDDGPTGEHVVACASAGAWWWDAQLADIGVLVHPAHRSRGLARAAVGATAEAILRDGRVPLYRHQHSNVASAAVAAVLGFEPALTMAVHRLR